MGGKWKGALGAAKISMDSQHPTGEVIRAETYLTPSPAP